MNNRPHMPMRRQPPPSLRWVAGVVALGLLAACASSDDGPAVTLAPGVQALAVTNPGFDVDAAGKLAGWTALEHNVGASYTFTADPAVYARSAPTSLRIERHGVEFFGLMEQRVRVQPEWVGRTVRLSGFMRTRGVTGTGAALVLVARDGSDHILEAQQMDDRRIRGDQDWQQVAVQLKVPSSGWWLQIGAMLQDDGALWVDDIALELMD